jgi:hypothetical protein
MAPLTREPFPSEPRRFSIPLPRPLWIGVVIAVIVASRIGVVAHQQYATIRLIERHSGRIEFQPVGPGWLRDAIGQDRMAIFDEITGVRFVPDRETVRKQRFAIASHAPGVNAQMLAGYTGPWTDDGYEIDDSTLAIVARVPSLRRLDLCATGVGDAGIKHLVNLPNLESLLIDWTNVSDAAVPSLAQLRKLRILDAKNTALTENGANQLRAALPSCSVRVGFDIQVFRPATLQDSHP